MGILKIEMPLEWWTRIDKKCKELNIDSEKYEKVKNYGKLYFDLQRHQNNKKFPIPEPQNYYEIK